MIKGKRQDITDEHPVLEIGEYGKKGNHWLGCTPNGLFAGLGNHEVVEHEDGTITASPSILVTHWSGKSWHGYLERGIWREV